MLGPANLNDDVHIIDAAETQMHQHQQTWQCGASWEFADAIENYRISDIKSPTHR